MAGVGRPLAAAHGETLRLHAWVPLPARGFKYAAQSRPPSVLLMKKSKEEKAAAKLLHNPQKAADILSTMPLADRRTVALTWALNELEEDFKAADRDKDGQLNYKEFRDWADQIIEDAARRSEVVLDPTRKQCLFTMFATMVPFMGFGFTDNGLMVIFGDSIDGTLGRVFGWSMLACAALGNAVSNIFGMMLHGTINKAADRLGLPDAKLTLAQRKMPVIHMWTTIGSCCGVFFGCLMGMCPLLFMDQKKKEAERGKDIKAIADENPVLMDKANVLVKKMSTRG